MPRLVLTVWPHNSSSSVSSSSLRPVARDGWFVAFFLLRVAIGLLLNGSTRGGGTPFVAAPSSVELCPTAELTPSVSDDPVVARGADSLSSSVSSSDCSGVAWSISIWSLFDSGAESAAGPGSAACEEALRLNVRDAPGLRVLVSSLID